MPSHTEIFCTYKYKFLNYSQYKVLCANNFHSLMHVQVQKYKNNEKLPIYSCSFLEELVIGLLIIEHQ